MFIGDVNMWRSIVVGRITRNDEERDDVDDPRPPVRGRAASPSDQRVDERRERVADERPLLEVARPADSSGDAERLGEEAGDAR